MHKIIITHPELGARTYHFAAPLTQRQAVANCRKWAIANGLYGARIRVGV